jgi:hypothetical protein
MSAAASLGSMAQQIFISLGVIFAALILQFGQTLDHSTALTAHEISPAFAISGIMCLIAVVLLLPLKPHAGAEVSGHVAIESDA